MSSRVEYLRRVPLFRELDEGDLARIAERSREEVFMPQASIVEIGDPGDCLYIIAEGIVQVLYPGGSTGELELARLGPGEFFGEMALLNEAPRSATVRAVKPVRTLVLERDDFLEIVRDSPGLSVKLLEVMSGRIRSADYRIGDLSDKVLRDTLTGLLNRRAFHERLPEEVDRTSRYGEPFSLILLDLDRFKSVNDTLGHDVGDELLAWVGRILIEHTRTADTPFRIGGEEFAIIAPGTPPREARIVAQRLLDTIAAARPPVEAKLRVTASAGYAGCPEHETDADALFRRADQALLQAKADGRRRVGAPA